MTRAVRLPSEAVEPPDESKDSGLHPLLVQKVDQNDILRKEEQNWGQLNEHMLPLQGMNNFLETG